MTAETRVSVEQADEQAHAQEVELQEIADGAYGDGPKTRGAARDRLAALASSNRSEGEGVWRCFHCGDVFSDESCARLHFGRDEDSIPACQIKAGAEQGLLGALRAAEYEASDARRAIADECTEAARAHYAQATRHDRALRNAEEAGYERGLADGRAPSAGVRDAGRGATLAESVLIDALHISPKLSCDDRVAILREAQRLAALTARPDGEAGAIPANDPCDLAGHLGHEAAVSEPASLLPSNVELLPSARAVMLEAMGSPATNAGGEREDEKRRHRAALKDIADAEAIPNDAEAFIWCRDVARQALATKGGAE